MSAYEQLEMRVAGQQHQINMLRDQVEELRRAGCGDRLVLIELCQLRGWTVAEALGPRRNDAVRCLRDGLSAARVARVFDITRRQVQRICRMS